jgi:hypothetical protein
MDRVRFVDHRGHRILLLDYSKCTSEAEMLKMVQIRKSVVAAQRPASLLTLTDITGAKFSRDVLVKVKEAAALDRPFIKRAAMVGGDSRSKAVSDAVSAFSARKWQRCATREEALDWLVEGTPVGAKSGASAPIPAPKTGSSHR